MAQCATTALASAVPRPCVRGAPGRFRGLGPVPGVVSLPFPPSRPACPALRVAGRPLRVSLTLARWYAIPRGLCVRRARSGCPSGSPREPFACVCARAPAASAPPPSRWCGVRTSRGPGTGRWQGRSTWSVLLRVSCPGPLLCLACLGEGGPVPVSPLPGCCCEGHLRSGAPPPPTARPLGGLSGSATHVLWARVRGCGGPTLSPWPACPVGAACRGGGVVGGRPRGGLACHCCEGRPSPNRPSSGRAAGAPYPLAVGAGGVRAWGPITNPTERALASWLCALWGRHEGVRGGAPPAWVWGVRGRALSHPRVPAL